MTDNYIVTRYTDGVQIGTAILSQEQYAHYNAMAQQPEGIMRLGSLPHDWYALDDQYQDQHEDTTIYLD